MSIPLNSLSSYIIATLLLIILISVGPITGDESPRKLDETGLPATPSDPSIKCGGCSPCGNPSCYQSPPPPAPPPPPPSPPPSPKKPPSSTPYCPPPPASPSSDGYIYMTTPPGNLYPVVQSSSGATTNLAAAVKIAAGCGLLGVLLILWT